MTDNLFLPDNPTDEQIFIWLQNHELPEDCLDAVKSWVEVCEEDSVSFGPGFSINIASIAISNCMVDYEIAMDLEDRMLAYSNYSGS